MDYYLPPASVQAYRQLIELNLRSWKPEVADWLHSEDAGPVLENLLEHVPCSVTMH
jgi:hypothetical protein